jgi:hypothetical protein
MIAYLGWGSLFWSPRAFRTHYDDWRIDGPHLPVEFCRVSNNGRLTLVVTDNVEPMPVLWAVATTKDVRAACEHLASREGCPLKRIATARPADASLPYDLKAWMQARGMHNMDENHRRVTIGHTWISAPDRGTVFNLESKLLLLEHIFRLPGGYSRRN